MKSPVVIGLVWIASLVLAFLVGANSLGERAAGTERGATGRRAVETPRAAEAGTRETATAADPRGEAKPAAGARGAAPAAAEAASEPAAGEPNAGEAFTLKGVDSLEEASRRFMKFAAGKLDAGPEGHKELLRAMEAILQDKSLRPLFRDEAAVVRLAYPWIRFLVEREGQVVALTETVYRTAANDPAWFEGLDDDTLEGITEGLAMLLPGVVGEEQMARFRGYVEKILATPQEQLPPALQKNLRRFRQNLEFWSPPLTAAQVTAQLLDPAVPTATKMGLLRKADPKALKGIDVAGILAAALAEGDRRAVSLGGRFQLGGGDLVRLDRGFMEGVARGGLQSYLVRWYLQSTGRKTWAAMEPFFKEGLGRGGKATDAFAFALSDVSGTGITKEIVAQFMRDYAMPEGTQKLLKQRYGLE